MFLPFAHGYTAPKVELSDAEEVRQWCAQQRLRATVEACEGAAAVKVRVDNPEHVSPYVVTLSLPVPVKTLEWTLKGNP